MFADVKARIPDVLYPMFAEDKLVVAGGALLRAIIGAVEADIDIFCVTPDAEAEVKKLLGPYVITSEQEGSDVKSVHYMWAGTVLDVVPLREDWDIDSGTGTVQAILDSFDIGISQFATNFEVMFLTAEALKGLVQRQVVQLKHRNTTLQRMDKYSILTGWVEHLLTMPPMQRAIPRWAGY